MPSARYWYTALRRACSVARLHRSEHPVWVWCACALAEDSRVNPNQMTARAMKARKALAPLVLEGKDLRFAHALAVQRLEIRLGLRNIVRVRLV